MSFPVDGSEAGAAERRNILTTVNADDKDDRAIRIGEEYQAVVPGADANQGEYAPPARLLNPRLLWSPTKCKLSEKELKVFVEAALASVPHPLQEDQILGILHWNDYDQKAALSDVQKYCCHPDTSVDWSAEEITLFGRAFEKYRKNFHKISAVFPSRNTRSIVRYYYHWKKTKRTDSRIQTLALDNETVMPAVDDSDGEEEAREAMSQARGGRGKRVNRDTGRGSCQNCGIMETAATAGDWRLRSAHRAHLCESCAAFWITWGRDKPTFGYGRPGKRPRLDFPEPATEKALRATLPMSTKILDDELARLQTPAMDASYVAQRKEQFEVEAELRRKFAVELPAGQQMVDRHTLGIKQESSNGGGGGESAGITNGNASGATSPATSISPTLSSTSASTMSSGITSPTTPHPPGWNDATLATFTNGLKSHGKNFHRISLDMLKGKKTANELRDYFKLHKSDRGLDAHVQVYFDRLRGLGVTGSNPG